MPFQIIRNDITKVKADAIVNTANPEPIYVSGTDHAIYEAAGAEALLAERKKIGKIGRGDVAVTPAFDLDAKYIIHTVGPVWSDGKHNEFDILTSCYEKSLKMATDLRCESIALPLISTGVYGFPKDKALQIAISVISKFLMENEINITLVVFDRKAFELSGKLFYAVDEFIDENYVNEKKSREFSRRYSDIEVSDRRRRRIYEEELEEIKHSEIQKDSSKIDVADQEVLEATCEYDMRALPKACMPMVNKDLDDIMGEIGETFQERLLRLVDERGLTDVEVYKSANMDRKLFSKIRCNLNYKPKKKTAIALAIALKLDLEETKDLLGRAELALSPSNKFDLIVEFFLTNQIYDIYEINTVLFKYNQQILGE